MMKSQMWVPLVFTTLVLSVLSVGSDCETLSACYEPSDCVDGYYCPSGLVEGAVIYDGECAKACPTATGDLHGGEGAPCEYDTDCDPPYSCDNNESGAPCVCVGEGTGGSGGSGPGCTCPGPDCVEFSDGTFGVNDWASQVVAKSGTVDYGVEQRSDDGNPRPYRFVSHVVGEESAIWVAHEKPDASYEPASEGAIASIHYSVDGKALATSRQASLKALAKQDDQWFWTTNLVLINESPDWETKTWDDTNLGPVSSGALNLEDGALITFGFYTGASHTGGVPEVTRNTGVDNWRVVICKQPEIP